MYTDAELIELYGELDLTKPYWQKTIAERVKGQFDQFALENADEGFRGHLGASVIGHDCNRYLYYHFRWFKREVHSARMERIFDKGHEVEAKIRQMLTARGAKFLDTVDTTGEQLRVSDVHGHFGGSVDGIFVWPEIGITRPTLLECKSSKTGSPFNDLAKKGMQESKPRHFSQQSVYGYKLNVQFAAYVVENKNDSDIYVEIVELSFAHAKELIRKAEFIILATEPPPRISKKRNFWVCNMCTMQTLCHDAEPPVANCRNCQSATPVANASWHCSTWNSIIPKEAIISGCPHHSFLPY